MYPRQVIQKILTVLAVCSLLLNALGPSVYAQTSNPIYLPLVANGAKVAHSDLLLRTHITVDTTAQWQTLTRSGALILDKGDDWALVLVDDQQLTDLARWRFNPEATNALTTLAGANAALAQTLQPLLNQMQAVQQQLDALMATAAANGKVEDDNQTASIRVPLRAAVQALDEQQRSALTAAASVDTDSDGLTDDQEKWWCTDPNNRDTDDDDATDGAEIQALKDWLNNKRFGPPYQTPWPDWPFNPATCPDKDKDSIPNSAENRELGLSIDLDSTDRDKFDDGQELFGVTYCTGEGGHCGYGLLPHNDDWGIIGAQMPSWVKAPGNHPLVAAFPVPEIDIIDSSFHVERITDITTEKGQMTQKSTNYSTSKTEGSSTSTADTETWNSWQESSVSQSAPLVAASVKGSAATAGGKSWFENFLSGEAKANVAAQNCISGAAAGSASLAGSAAASASGCVNVNVGSLENSFNVAKELTFSNLVNLKDNTFRFLDNVQTTIKTNFVNNGCIGLININCGQGASTKLTGVQQAGAIVYADTTQDRSGNGNQSQYVSYPYPNNSQQGDLAIRQYEPIVYPLLSPPMLTQSNTTGKSVGGAHTTTTGTYEEHTVTNGEQFTTGEDWRTATALDSAHAAELWFTYKVRNTGTEYAREISSMAFNIYIGDDSNPAYTYFVAPDLGGDGKFHNFMPAEDHQYTSRHIPLTLNQMKAIDLGGPLRIVVEDFTYGADEFFYQGAANAGIQVAIEDGADDGDEAIDIYLIPTWNQENVLSVLSRYFPNETDSNGTLTAIWTPEYRSDTPSWCKSPRRPTDQPSKAVWCKHVLSTADWWNVYTDGLGDGSEGFQTTQAVPGSVALFRFNKDTDLDGFSDRSEKQLGTDPADASSFPHPELLAGVNNIRTGNKVVSTLSLLNTGLYDAYGVEAVMVAPDDSTSITNNTVGGSGRVRAQKQVIVGSRLILQSPLPSAWTQANHATPGAGGYYTGDQDRTYTFTVNCSNPGGCKVGSGSWALNWSDGKGGSGSLNFSAGYASPTFLPVGNLGVTLALYTGNVTNGDSFTVAANTPRDTFQYTINREPYTEPLVIVSYNDPQGNHRFVVPPAAMHLTQPTDNLQQFAGTMLPNVGVELVTSAPFSVGSNTATLLVNNPADKTFQNAHLYLELINISGTVVSEVPTQVNLPPGPTSVPVSFNTSSFNPAYQANQDYILMAFLTDYQGNILDTAGRPLSSFQVDPLPKLASDDASLTWNFGSVAQGALLKHELALANTGFGRLYTYIPPGSGLALANMGSRTVGAADQPAYALTLRTADLPVGAYNQTITLATSDTTNPARTVRIQGTITAPANDTLGAMQRPFDVPVTVAGSHTQGEWFSFTHDLGPNPQSLHPVKVYSQDNTTLFGVGKYGTNFGQGTASSDMFGDGRDGVMPSSGNLNDDNGFGWGWANGTAGSSSVQTGELHGLWRINPGDAVLIHQTQGSGAGCWELNKAVSDFGGEATYQLTKPLKCNYSTSGNNKAQIMRVPQYSSCNVTGTVTATGWNGSWGGIFAVMCNSTLNIQGNIAAIGGNGATSDQGNPAGGNGGGFRGGQGDAINHDNHGCGFQGEGTAGTGSFTPAANGNGGGAGCGSPSTGNYGTGAGGGNGTPGANSAAGGQGIGGLAAGNAELTSMVFGGGGAGSNDNPGNSIGGGGGGGGIILLAAKNVNVSGTIRAIGGNGGGNKWGGGGGSGGSVLIKGETITLGTDLVAAHGGIAGNNGGGGSVGRIRVEYCNSSSGRTNPPASAQKLDCYITEQVETAPYTTARLNLPETFSNGRTYNVQFGRKLDFTAAGEQTTTLRVTAGLVSTVTLDALINNVGAGSLNAKLDIGNDGVWDWDTTQNVNNAPTLASPNLATAFNNYWSSHGAPTSGTLDVPVKFALNQPAQALLTNLKLTTPASKLRTVRLAAQSYTAFNLDFTVGEGSIGPVSVALDIGDNGSIDWNAAAGQTAPVRLTTGNLATALNDYMSGRTGDVDVPIRVYLAPAVALRLNDFAVNANATRDLVTNSINVSASAVTAANADSILLNAGDTATVQATLSSSNGASGPVTAAFFATAAGWGDWYIGSAFVPNIPSGGSAPVSIVWNTTGFSGTVPVKVVINPYCRVTETNCKNNSKSTTVVVNPPVTIPAAPSNLAATVTAPTQINLSWTDASNNEDGFKIERSPDGTTNWTQIATVGANVTTYANAALTCGTAYSYRVRAYNTGGDSGYSNTANAQTVVCPPASSPSNLAATLGSATQINLTWVDNSNNESGFKVEHSLDGTTGWAQITTVSANVTSYANTGLTCGTTYYYRVRASNAGGDSNYSNVANAQTTVCPPSSPSNLGAIVASATQINLSWTDNSNNETGFKLERSPDGTTGWTQLATVGANVTSYANTGLTCGTTYYYRVRASNAGGDSTYSNVANAQTTACLPSTPTAPSNLVTAPASQTQLNLSWTDNSNNETGFKIERSPDGSTGWLQIATVSANVTSYANTGLTCGTTYYYRVRASNAGGDSAYGNVANAQTAACPPSTPTSPTNLVATATGQTQINVTWADNSNNEDGFKLERSVDGATNWTQITTVGANVATYANTGLTCGTTYYYRVRAYNAGGDSAYSNIANTQTVVCLPASPSGLAATPSSATQINLTWADNSNNETGFKLERSPDGTAGWTQIATIGTNLTSYADTNLSCGATYFYRLRAYNAGGDSGYSNSANAKTSMCIPPTPTNLTATSSGQTQINLSWTDNSNNEDNFKIERSADDSTGWTQIALIGANTTLYANIGLTCGTTYSYRVRAANAGGDSVYSNVANAQTASCITPTPAAPSNLVATAAGTTQINLSWKDNSTNETGFKLERSPNGTTGWDEIATVGGNVTSYANTGLICKTSYYYRVRATNTGGDSAYTNVANAQTAACPVLPKPPSKLAAAVAGATQLNLSWKDNSNNEDGFKLERSPDGANGWTQLATVAANGKSYADTGLSCGATYYYRVRAYNGGGDSAFSNVVNTRTALCPPTPPSNLSAGAAGATQINLTWVDNSNNETGFKIERSLDGSGWTPLTTVAANSTSYADTGLKCETAYYYRVRATNAGGDSAYSNGANTQTSLCPPDVIFADGFESGDLSKWTANTNPGNLSVTPSATLVGTKGLQVTLNSNTVTYLTDDKPNAELRYRARFYFDPNTITMKSGDAHYIFYGYSGTTTVVLRVEFGNASGKYQLRVGLVNDSTSWKMSKWAPMTDGPHWVELDWQAAASPTAKNGSLTFWLDGVQKESLSKIDNDTRRIDSVQLGAVFGIDTGTRGVYYFDAFEAHQQQPIGQAANGAAAALAEAGVTDTVLLEADVPLTLSTTALQSNADTLVSAQVDGLQVHISFTANTVVEPAIALILRSDNTTIPDGYRVLATPFRVELQAVNGVALTTDGPPFVVTLAYGELVDPTPPNRELALQRWNAATESWESMPATLNAADQTIMAALEQPATLALFEQEEASVQQIYLPIIQQ